MLGLGEFPFERIDLDEHHVCVRLQARVFRGGIETHQIARHQFELLQRQHAGTGGFLFPRLFQHSYDFFGAAVDRIADVGVLEAEFILGMDRDRHLLDRARAVIAARPRDADGRRVCLARLDEKILGETNRLPLIEGGDVVDAILFNLDRALIVIAFAARESDLLAVAEHEEAVFQRSIGENLQIGAGAFQGAEIAAALFHRVFHSGPGRVVVGHLDLLHRGQIYHADVEVGRAARAGLDIIFDVLWEAGENELVARGARSRLHRDLFPFRCALIARVQKNPRVQNAHGLSSDELVRIAANGCISRADAKVVQRRRAGVRAGPEQMGAVAEKSWRGDDHPEENTGGGDANTQQGQEPAIGREGSGFDPARDVQGVGGQQRQKRIVITLLFGEGDETLLELRKHLLGCPDCSTPVQAR